MKTMVAGVLCLLLAGCATERYYPVYLAEGDGYYVAEREYGAVDPGTRYDSLFAVGVYPWWVHTFYSPYFYPYYFTYYHPYYYPYYGPYHLAGWYPAWSYDPGYESRYGYGWPPYWPHRNPAPQRVTAPLDTAIRARALTPGISPDTFVPGGSAPGARARVPPAAAYFARSPAAAIGAPVAPVGQPVAPVGLPLAPAASGRPFSGEPGRSHLAPPERARIERDRAERVE